MLTKKRPVKKLISLNKKEQKAFLFIFFISLLCLSSLLQSNQLYIDDFLRVMQGETYWEANARPMASFVSLFFQLGKPLTDISPLPQIICVALYALGIIYLARVFEIDNLLLLTLSGIIFVINPYNLSLYSFIFDSFPMGLGVFCSIASFCLAKIGIQTIKQRNYSVLAFLSSVILLIISLCLYQPTSSFYLVSFTFYLLVNLCEELKLRNSLSNFLIYLTVLLLSFLAYIPIKNHYIEGTYTSTYSKFPTLTQIPETITKNIISSWNQIIWGLQHSIMLFLIIGMLMLIVVTIIIQIIRNNLKQKKRLPPLITSLLLGIFYYFILICSFVFPSLILAQPVWTGRIFTGFTAVVGMGCLFLAHFCSVSKFSLFKYILIFYLCLIVLSFTNLSLTYGNVIHHQNVYEQRIGTLIIADLEEAIIKLSLPLDKPKISFANTEHIRDLRTSILNLKALEKYPILYSLAYPYFTADNFGITKFRTFGLNFEAKSNQEFIDENKGYYIPTNEAIVSRQLYDIHLENSDTFVIVFKE
jgi:hypothetical protein